MGFMYTVKRGDHLAKIADRFGFRQWETIYKHARNAGFRARRPNPHVIFAGNVIYIPDKDPKKQAAATGRKHRFQLTGQKLDLRVMVKDHHGRSLANEPYTLKIGEGTRDGVITDAGWLHEKIPATLETAELFLKRQKIRWTLHVGRLDPVMDEDTQGPIIFGIQQRLNNLGFHCGEVDGVLGPMTERALKMFQHRAMGRQIPDGVPDKDTLDALRDGHQS